MFVGDLVDKRYQEVQSRCERARVLAQALLDPGILLGHDLDGPRDENDGNDENDDGNFHEEPLFRC
ncbi:hypothetical protein D3C72_2572460 [compost metagenome]